MWYIVGSAGAVRIKDEIELSVITSGAKKAIEVIFCPGKYHISLKCKMLNERIMIRLFNILHNRIAHLAIHNSKLFS